MAWERSEVKTFPIRLDDELHKALKHAAIDKGVSLQKLVVDVLRQKAQKDSHIQRHRTREKGPSSMGQTRT